LSSRKEFAPLDKEILKLGKDIVTGKKIEIALQDMADRINSVKIKKTVTLIISGIKSGGNLAILLEETSRNIKEKEFVEKRAASNTLMYVIFIFFATAAGAPFLFALSSVLVEVMTNLFSTLPEVETTSQTPFAITEVSISITFIKYFSVIFIIVIDILGSLIIGLVSKGEEKEGLKYVAPLVITGITIFFVVRGVILSYFSDLI
jgi:archaellum biogenesis protein FlaJ (TadC family)